jgi:hypothetical protein
MFSIFGAASVLCRYIILRKHPDEVSAPTPTNNKKTGGTGGWPSHRFASFFI